MSTVALDYCQSVALRSYLAGFWQPLPPLMIALFSAVIPVGCIVMIGFIAGKTLIIDRPTISRLLLYVLFPILIIDTLYRTSLTPQNMAGMGIGFILTYISLCLIAWAIARYLNLSRSTEKSLIATTSLSNVGNMGLSVTLLALGEAGLERAIVYLIAWNLVVLVTAPAIIKGGGWQSSLKFTLRLPLFWSIIAALVLYALHIKLPFNIDKGLNLVAESAIPLGLLLLGLEIAESHWKISLYEVGASFLRLIGGAIIAYGVGSLLRLSDLDLQVLILQSAMPTAITAFLMVNEFGGDQVRTARVVVVSTILSFLTLPLVLWGIKAIA